MGVDSRSQESGFQAMDDVDLSDSDLVIHVRDILIAVTKGDADEYNQLVAILHRKNCISPDDVAGLVTTLKALSGAVLYIDSICHESLLSTIFSMSMWDYEPDVMDALVELIISLATSSGKYVDLCLEMLVSNFIPSESFIPRLNPHTHWSSSFEFLRQEAVWRAISDHHPILLASDKKEWGPAPFRFDNTWLQRKDFISKVEDWWGIRVEADHEGFGFMVKLRQCKEKMKVWAAEEKELKEGEKLFCQRRISSLDKLEERGEWDESRRQERICLKGRYAQFLLEEETAVRLKSKWQWAKEGDANSKMFHALMSARRSRNAIFKLQGRNGDTMYEDNRIVEEVNGYFRELYSAAISDRGEWEGISWHKISHRQAAVLEKPFSEAEIRHAINCFDGCKSPGPDGFSMAFFQKCWDIVKGDLLKVFQEFWNSGVVNNITNETYICLVPKKADSTRISDFRPISLVTSLYKILGKVLAERMKAVLHGTISEVQGAFVEGRQIGDLALIANEVVEYTRSRKKEAFVFKIDFEKAYDRVDWEFLDFVLEQKGFGARWRKWIRGCVSSVSFSVFVNGRPRDRFKGYRGLRQGDALSPYLFTIVVDALTRRIEREVSSGNISLLPVGTRGLGIAQLQFADDTLFFSKPESESLFSICRTVDSFCKASGLKVNWTKSSLLGINTCEALIASLATSIGCTTGSWPTVYLGFPLGGNPRSQIFWKPVVDKVSKRLAGWKKAFLSKGGRLALIQSVLSALPSYYMSVFRMPASVVQIIEKLMRDFFWEGFDSVHSRHLIKWSDMCQPKTLGGLGIGSLDKKNVAFLSKWLWRFPNETDSLWHKLIVEIYGRHSNGWDSGPADSATFRSPWKAIKKCSSVFLERTSWKVGSGDTVRFWRDKWCSSMPLGELFPGLRRLSSLPDATVDCFIREVASEGSGEVSWNFQLPRNLTDRESDEMTELLHLLSGMRISPGRRDRRVWLSDVCSFSVKEMFLSLFDGIGNLSVLGHDLIWKSVAPSKVAVFMWFLAKGRLYTNDLRQRISPFITLSPGWCVLCKRDNESINHTFLHCPFSSQLWSALLGKIHLSWAFGEGIDSAFGIVEGSGHSLKWKQAISAAIQAICWSIWLERNKRIFDGVEDSLNNVWDRVYGLVAFWLHARQNSFRGILFSDLVRNWEIFIS